MSLSYRHIERKFFDSMRSTVGISLLFECLRLAHQVFLWHLFSPARYGLYGSIFSSIYLATAYFLCGAPRAIAPLLKTFTESQWHFRNRFIPFICLHMLVLSVGACMICFGARLFPFVANVLDACPALLVSLLIISEGIRIIGRTFLHTVFWHRYALYCELASFMCYLLLVWAPYVVWHKIPTVWYLFATYAGISVLVSFAFITAFTLYYYTLPAYTPSTDKEAPWWYSYCVSLSQYIPDVLDKGLLTGNFLVALLAMRAGLAEAGMFKFASYIVDAARGIARAAVQFSGNAFLANLKYLSLEERRKGFSCLSNFLHMTAWMAFVCCASIGILFILYGSISPLIVSGIVFFLILAYLGHMSSIYHTLYIIEKRTVHVIILRLLELIAAALIYAWMAEHVVSMIVCIVGIRLVTLIYLAGYARYAWQISLFGQSDFQKSKKNVLRSYVKKTFVFRRLFD